MPDQVLTHYGGMRSIGHWSVDTFAFMRRKCSPAFRQLGRQPINPKPIGQVQHRFDRRGASSNLAIAGAHFLR